MFYQLKIALISRFPVISTVERPPTFRDARNGKISSATKFGCSFRTDEIPPLRSPNPWNSGQDDSRKETRNFHYYLRSIN